MLAIFFYWLSLCLLILAPAIAISLIGDYKIKLMGMFTLYFVVFIAIHVIVSAVPFILTTLLMLTSVT